MMLIIFLSIFSVLLSTTLIVPTNYPTIQAGFDAAADGDTILVLDGSYSGEGNIGLAFSSDDRTLILKSENGPENCIIDCQGLDRFIHIYNTDISIEGFKIINGYAGDGGAIVAGWCNISHCIFWNNQANGGGAIFLTGGIGEISRCIFQNNSASLGGAISTSVVSTILISNCVFSNNITPTGLGTILYSGWSSNTISFYNSILLGAIDNNGSSSITLNNSLYPENVFNLPSEMPDPLFVDADNYDFHLLVESPAINAGTTDLSWPDDAIENYFPLDPDGTQPDIGVYPYYLDLQGDANFDGEIDVIDIVLTVNVILGSATPFNAQVWAMDLNEDEVIDVLDIILIVGLIIGNS